MNGSNTPRIGLRLDALDTLFFRDGRPFGPANRVSGGLPNPQTLAGALRTALLARNGFDFRKFARLRKANPDIKDLKPLLRDCGAKQWVIDARFRGPWLALSASGQTDPLLELPAILSRRKSNPPSTEKLWLKAKPWIREYSGWNDPDGLLPLWREGEPDTKAEVGMFTLSAAKKFLHQQAFSEEEFFLRKELFDFDDRTGIAIDMDSFTTAKGQIYGIRMLSLKKSVRPVDADPTKWDQQREKDPFTSAELFLYTEIVTDEASLAESQLQSEPIPFGGEGRYARVSIAALADWPVPDPEIKSSMWLMVTPGFFPCSKVSKRALPEVAGLRAAASGAGVAVSGWDIARNGPRATRFAIPSGAVYFFQGSGPKDGFLGNIDDDKVEGWGFALQGKYEDQL